jgi:hypothetical protein
MTIPIEVGEEIETDFVNVDTSRFCLVAVDVTVRSDHVHVLELTGAAARKKKEEYHLQYSFPFQYSVLDADGNTIHFQTTKIAHNDDAMRMGEGIVDNPTGGSMVIEHDYAKFKVREPGRLQVKAHIQPDTEYGAVIESATLIVYDNASKHAGSILGGMAMMCFSPLLIIIGGLLTLVGFLSGRQKRTNSAGMELPSESPG